MKLHQEILPLSTAHALKKISGLGFAKQFYLAGGTGLALQLGHRFSEDLDFFSATDFDSKDLPLKLSELGKFELFQKEKQTISGSLDKVKISFLGYKYPLLGDLSDFSGFQIAAIEDIACMKLDAIASRGTKRDFIDLYFLVREKLPLEKIFKLFEKKYAAISFNLLHIKKSLIYFTDADEEPLPQMLKPVSWEKVKRFFTDEVVRLEF
ncbi:nucleotidyl transferase AbiEii/AbiGii toxin family protein [Patescibacteria group bacterium]|nr:nucleotidyl transferase AbiEii/AbiGii toxin family protein [Patescibacteria group bacterium]